MTWLNYDDARGQIEAAGLLLGDDGGLDVDTARPVRCRVAGGDREKRGWYWLSSFEIRGGLYITGAYGVYHADDAGKQTIRVRLDGKAVEQSQAERDAIRRRNAERRRQADAEARAIADRAADRARAVWSAYLATGSSDYLARKGVGAHGLRFDPKGAGTVAVPMLRDGTLVGLQIIRGREHRGKLEKEYFPGGMDKRGAYHQLGRIVPGAVVIVAEGYATAASIYEALGQQIAVIVAFDSGSLAGVADALKRRYRRLHLIFAADDDHVQRCRATVRAVEGAPPSAEATGHDQARDICRALTPVADSLCRACGQPHGRINVGIEAARLAAHATEGTWLAPVFAVARRPDAKAHTDFNDLHLAEGLHVVREQLDAHLLAAGLQDRAGAALQPRGAGTARPGDGGGPASAASAGARDTLDRQVGVDDAMRRYSLVYGGKGTLFDHAEHCLVPKSDVLDICPDHAWRDIKRLGGLPLVRLDEIGFDPAETDPSVVCNLWGGWPTAPKPGKCDAILWLLEHLCSHEKNTRDVYQWVLKWLAYPIQHPGAKMRTALVMHGPQGVGKNLLFEAVMAIYGHYGRIIDQASLEDKFNDWASRKLFLIADEVVSRAELFHVKNKLKQFITGEWIRINPKNVMAHDERNHVNVVFLSNDRQPLVLERDDRRYTVIWTPEKLGRAQYEAVRDEIRAGGVAALHHYLLNLDLGDFDAFAEAPMTQSKRDLIALGLESTERFLDDWAAGDIPGRMDGDDIQPMPYCPCSSADLYATYKRWCALEGVTRPREQATFLGHIAKLQGWSKGHKDVYATMHHTGATKRCRMVVPSTAALGDALKRAGATDYRQPEGQTQAQWLTDCFFAFRNAMPRPQ